MALGLLAGGLLGTGKVAIASGPQCLTFAGFPHCAVGGATLELPPTNDRIVVNNPTKAIGNGVSIQLPDVRVWKGTLVPQFAAGTTPILRSSSLADGVVTSRSEAKKSGTRVALSASFTGSEQGRKYTASVHRNGVLVGLVPHIPSDEPGAYPASTILVQMMLFGVIAQTGQCEWIYAYSTDQSVLLPDGRVLIGDEIRLTEEVDPSGGYPYTTFDGLTFQGNFVRNDLKSESVTY